VIFINSRYNLVLTIFFSVLAAVIAVATAFVLGVVMDAAAEMDAEMLITGIVAVLALWPIDFVINILVSKFRITYICNMLEIAKNQRLQFVFCKRDIKPAKDASKELSFFTADIDVLRGEYYRNFSLIAFRLARILLSIGAMIWISPWLTLVFLAC